MNQYEKSEIEEMEKYIGERLDQVEQLKDGNEMAIRGDVLLNIFKVLKFYDDLKPTLKKALDDIHYKEKWYLDKED